MARIAIEVELADEVDAQHVVTWLAMAKGVKSAAIVPLPEPADEPDDGLIEVIEETPAGTYPALERTKHLWVRISPEFRVPLSRMQFSMCSLFLHRGVIRGHKALITALRQHDPEVWQTAPDGSATKLYGRFAITMEKTPFPLIRGRKGVYGLRVHEAASLWGQRAPRKRDLDNER